MIMNKKLEKILKEKEENDIKIIPNGVIYQEKLGLFEKKSKGIIINFERKK
jgi:hypothetical protein